jgi:hypothetical protein
MLDFNQPRRLHMNGNGRLFWVASLVEFLLALIRHAFEEAEVEFTNNQSDVPLKVGRAPCS